MCVCVVWFCQELDDFYVGEVGVDDEVFGDYGLCEVEGYFLFVGFCYLVVEDFVFGGRCRLLRGEFVVGDLDGGDWDVEGVEGDGVIVLDVWCGWIFGWCCCECGLGDDGWCEECEYESGGGCDLMSF